MTDVLENMKAELDECVVLLRPHYPEEDNEQLHDHATGMRMERYARGRWPSDDELVKKKAAAVAKAAAEKAAAEKAA